MRALADRRLIPALVVAAALLAGCSTTEMAYDNAHWLIRSRVDDYFDLTDEQENFLDARLKALVRWHRYEELPRYADDLTAFMQQVSDGMTRAELEGFFDTLNEARLRLVRKTLLDVSEFLATTTPEQLAVFDEQVKESMEDDRERASLTPEERRTKRSEDILAGLQPWFGEFSEQQKLDITALSNALPDTFAQWMEQRERRHQAFLAMMRKQPDAQEIYDQLWFWLSDIGASYPPEAQKVRALFWDAWFDMMIAIDQLITPEQRQHALRRLGGWRDEFIRLSQIDRG